MASEIIRKSWMNKVKDFTTPLTDVELCNLQAYLLFGYADKEYTPSEIEIKFCEIFFDFVDWLKFTDYQRFPEKYSNSCFVPYNKSTEYNLREIGGFVTFYTNIRFNSLLKKIEKEKATEQKIKTTKPKDVFKPLKADLKEAVNNSYEDEVFSKIEGWCNVMDVLMKYKLLTDKDFE